MERALPLVARWSRPGWRDLDDHGGDAAYLRPVPGQPPPEPGELRAWCRERLAPYKTPLHWVFVDAFPMTPSGKIQKYRLRESSTANQAPRAP